MKTSILYTLLIAVALLSGCATENIVTSQSIRPYIPSLPPRVKMETVEWKIINVESNAYFALDANNYKALSKNIAETTAYLAKVRTIVYSLQSSNVITTVPQKKSFLSKLF